MIKLVAIDIDGTLLNDHHEVTPKVNEAIQKAKQMGVKVVLCTGRPLVGVEQYLSELKLREEGDYVISFNGALVQDTHSKEVVSHLTLTQGDLVEIAEAADRASLHMHFFDEKTLYTPNRNIGKYTVVEAYLTNSPLVFEEIQNIPFDFKVSKAMMIDEQDILEAGIKKLPSDFYDKYHLVRSAPFYLEILNRDASKGNAVHQLADLLHIDQSEVMCIGDHENDVTMLEYAGTAVAMGNAIQKLKDIADFVTETNNNDGVAAAFEKFIFNQA
ncbi:haloacid dehalogenase [Listeria floridensis FSL S10-1187]|uniref:Haloacid dehalogenase n=1 Tax=Listeria floridensis FSL S10-1187 TaxID=1265817 RepID=A0ABN0RIK7_9LIST|nr:sugar-phosphatase [Listeria floridensis]EUJ33823.1 haloacid dehalogenase [Listeria floridensis FSL S10-1187]